MIIPINPPKQVVVEPAVPAVTIGGGLNLQLTALVSNITGGDASFIITGKMFYIP